MAEFFDFWLADNLLLAVGVSTGIAALFALVVVGYRWVYGRPKTFATSVRLEHRGSARSVSATSPVPSPTAKTEAPLSSVGGLSGMANSGISTGLQEQSAPQLASYAAVAAATAVARAASVAAAVSDTTGRMFSIADGRPPQETAISEAEVTELNRQIQKIEAIKTYKGLLAHQIPDTMVVGVQEILEVRLGTEVEPQVLTLGIVGGGTLVMQNLPVVETMTIELYSTDSSFTIEPRSAADQLVHKKILAGSPLQNIGSPYGRWVWAVTPQQTGDKTLALRVSAKVVDTLGNPTNETVVPDREFKVSVRVNKKAMAMGVGKWAIITAPVAAIGILFSEAIRVDGWPKIREQLVEAYGALQVWISQNF